MILFENSRVVLNFWPRLTELQPQEARPKFSSISDTWSTDGHLVDRTFGRLDILSTGHLVDRTFGRTEFSSTGHLVDRSFGGPDFWSIGHLVDN